MTESYDEIKSDPSILLIFLFIGLAIGIVASQILSRYAKKIPFTVVMFIIGIGLAVFTKSRRYNAFTVSIDEWVRVNPDVIVYTFLPPLIFGEAMNLNWGHVKGALVPSTWLAGPGVLIGAALMGVFVKYVLPYNWSWKLSLLFGSILSATDPVAVVALLKEVGASPKLTIIIVGESLMNDGTAMVCFTLFRNLIKGVNYNVGDIIWFFISATFGSCLVGIIIGLVTVYWLRTANRPLKEEDSTTQILITITVAYLTFFVAQYSFQISGVLACCGAGLMLTWLSKPIILSHESMHNVWSVIEFCMNTLIFLIAGLIIGHRILGRVNTIDWLYLFVLYFVLMIIRAFVVTLCYPFLSNKSHQVTLKEAIFMSWAGLRGALAIALALIVEAVDTDDAPDIETSRLLFFVGGIAALTLFFNVSFVIIKSIRYI